MRLIAPITRPGRRAAALLTTVLALAFGQAVLQEERAARAADAPAAARGQMQAVMVEKAPAVDGTLSDPIWQKSPALALGPCTSDKPAEIATTARVLFSPTHLLVAWDCAEPSTEDLKAEAADRDGPVWQDDSVELFVTGDLRTGYYHFAVNPKGTLFDARTFEGQKDDTGYNAGAKAAAAVQKGKSWTVTLSVPLKDLGAYVGKDQTWVVNIYRTRPARGGKPAMEWSWSVMGGNDYHQVSDFGAIKGVEVPKRDDGVTRAATAPPPPASYDKGQEKGGVTVYKSLDKLDIPDDGKGTNKGVPLMIRGSTDLKVAMLARGTGGADAVNFNMTDKRSNDNTTSYSYRAIDGNWRPLVYYVDRFRYNSNLNRVAANTDYRDLRFFGNAHDGKAALHLQNLVIYRGEDRAPPEAPTDLKAAADDKGVHLSWSVPADNVGAASYAVSRAGADGKWNKVAHVYTNACTDLPAEAGEYKYRLLAVDFQDNVGDWSKEAAVKVAAGLKSSEPTVLEKDRAGYAENVRKIHDAGKGKVRAGWVLCFGDSITGATSYRVFTESSLGRYRVEANGRAGWTTDGCRKVIEGDLEKENPEFCLIMLGTNNNKSEKALPAAMDDLIFMAKACAAKGTVPIIATIPPRAFDDPDSKPEAGYNAQLIKTCRENKIPVAYVFEAFQAGGDRKKLLAGDGIHLMDGGWAVTGPAWRDALEQVNFVVLDKP